MSDWNAAVPAAEQGASSLPIGRRRRRLFSRRDAGVPLLILLLLSCSGNTQPNRIEFWALGREGEVVAEFMPEFERETGIHVDIQQIPWTAAHEKILTAHVGNALPDVAQVGNTWISELQTVGAIAPLPMTLVPRADYFPGIWDTNVVGGTLYGVPWYVDTRVMFYRTDMIPNPPRTWSELVATLDRLKKESKRPHFYPLIMPTNEWPQPVSFAMQRGATLVDEAGHARFEEPQFIEAFTFYVDLYRRGYVPAVSNAQIANLHQQFAAGDFAIFMSGPWDIGQLRDRLTPEQQKTWSTAPLPTPDGAPYPGLSLSGGSSLVLSKSSKKKEAAQKLIAFLSRPDIQARFYLAIGDLPARRSAWKEPKLVADREIAAFRTQLDRTFPLPRLPEAENMVISVAEIGQLTVRGQYTPREGALALDRKIERMLEKRRWVLEKKSRVASSELREPAYETSLATRNPQPATAEATTQ